MTTRIFSTATTKMLHVVVVGPDFFLGCGSYNCDALSDGGRLSNKGNTLTQRQIGVL
jgi:hypothetical protein